MTELFRDAMLVGCPAGFDNFVESSMCMHPAASSPILNTSYIYYTPLGILFPLPTPSLSPPIIPPLMVPLPIPLLLKISCICNESD